MYTGEGRGRGVRTFGLLLEEFLAGAGAAGGFGVGHCLYCYFILWGVCGGVGRGEGEVVVGVEQDIVCFSGGEEAKVVWMNDVMIFKVTVKNQAN